MFSATLFLRRIFLADFTNVISNKDLSDADYKSFTFEYNKVIHLYWRNLREFCLFVKVLFVLVLECGAKR